MEVEVGVTGADDHAGRVEEEVVALQQVAPRLQEQEQPEQRGPVAPGRGREPRHSLAELERTAHPEDAGRREGAKDHHQETPVEHQAVCRDREDVEPEVPPEDRIHPLKGHRGAPAEEGIPVSHLPEADEPADPRRADRDQSPPGKILGRDLDNLGQDDVVVPADSSHAEAARVKDGGTDGQEPVDGEGQPRGRRGDPEHGELGVPDRREDGPEPEGVEPEPVDEEARQRRQEHEAGRDQTGDDEKRPPAHDPPVRMRLSIARDELSPRPPLSPGRRPPRRSASVRMTNIGWGMSLAWPSGTAGRVPHVGTGASLARTVWHVSASPGGRSGRQLDARFRRGSHGLVPSRVTRCMARSEMFS